MILVSTREKRASFAWPLGLLSVEGTLSSMLGQPLGLT
jgi:hypothetical protein